MDPLNMTRAQINSALLDVANRIMSGKQTVADANTLLNVRFSLMSDVEKQADYSEAAAALGSIKTEKKATASRENGSAGDPESHRRGGRPKGSKDRTPRKLRNVLDDIDAAETSGHPYVPGEDPTRAE